MSIDLKDRVYGAYFGAILGDVLGASSEFLSSAYITFDGDLTSGGQFNLGIGDYTDDTSMIIATIESIRNCGSIDSISQIREFCKWYLHGKYSSTGVCFDIGTQTRASLEFYLMHQRLLQTKGSCGNGALMRMIATILFSLHSSDEVFDKHIRESSISTHSDANCIAYTIMYSRWVRDVILEVDVRDSLTTYRDSVTIEHRGYVDGYVLNSINHSVDAFLSTDSYASCIHNIIHRGGDTDTNACIVGMLAGATYGYQSLNQDQISKITHIEYLRELIDYIWDTYIS